MNRRLVVLCVAGLFLLAGCGGSSKKAGSYASTPTSNPVSSTPGASSTTPSVTTAQGAPPTTTPTRPPPGDQNVRIPATFSIRAGGALSPRSISSPAFLAIELSVASRDGKSHHIVLRTPKPQTLSVPAGGRASILISGQRAGHYAIAVDGAVRGALNVGGEPGP